MTPSRFVTAAAATALLGLGAAGCGTQPGITANQTPQKQHLTGSATASPHITAPPLRTSPVSPGVPGWVQVKLTGTLPATGPATGTVHELPSGAVAAATVQALASALHLSGSPTRVPGGWRVTGSGNLQIADSDGQHWMYLGLNMFQPCVGSLRGPATGTAAWIAPRAAQPGAATVACPVKPGQLEPFDPIPGQSGGGVAPSVSGAEAVAMPVLQAVGLAGAPLRTATIGSYTFVSADPTVDGLPTAGFSTTIGVGPGNRIVQASGWLSHAVPGDTYPLTGARQAFARLKSSTHPTAHPPHLMCPLNPDVLCGTPSLIRQIDVTGAVYGLALSFNQGQPVLVPAWLFAIAGSGLRIPEVAINPHYLTG